MFCGEQKKAWVGSTAFIGSNQKVMEGGTSLEGVCDEVTKGRRLPLTTSIADR